ncbi:alpha/beta hydrolase [Ferruginibacter lapsinanis]|uniref:alpha/beta hydrolase n=1 Tax=Ferruginibacter lapsinanis TaxID=563172 RepID=UPI001E2BDFD5|nr:alpha/beta hydrolase [Ferruginibacter lapsinanis]UEG49304.1 alpha/beta hydrolase [Ferruginibacter lapsinanis]
MKLRQRLIFAFFRRKIKFIAAFSKQKAAEEAFKILCTPFPPDRDTMPLIYQQAKSVKFVLHGKKVRGYRWKNSGSVKRVLIIHGFSSASHRFEKYIISLLNRGFEVLAFDAPAHGRSQGRTINALDYRDMIVKAIDRFGPIDHFIAHSFGGLALCLALEDIKDNEKFKVALIAPATETTTTIRNMLGMLKISDKSMMNEIENLIFKVSHQQIEWFSIKRAMNKIRSSVLWVHDKDDEITPYADVVELEEKQLPNITFYVTNGLGHHKIYNNDDVREQVINFL